jgi:DNA-binding transcriptional regulator YhcF (GntR family)
MYFMNTCDNDAHISKIVFVADYFRAAITGGQFLPGDVLPSTRAAAKQLGVHHVTVANAYRNLAADGIVALRPGAGALVATLSAPRSLLFCMVSSDEPSVRGTHTMNMAEDILEHFADQELPAELRVVKAGADQWGRFLQWLKIRASAKTLAGIWLADMLREEVIDVCGLLAKWSVPVVNLAPQSVPIAPFTVGSDTLPAIRQGTRRLIKQGCRNIVMLCAGPRHYQIPEREEAFRATCEALEAHGEVLAMGVSGRMRREDFEMFGSRAVMNRMRTGKRPDGLIITDDFIGRGALASLLRLGVRVPDDLQVCTHARREDSYPGIFGFPVTTMLSDDIEWARVACEMMERIVAGENVGEPHKRLSVKVMLLDACSVDAVD